MSSKDKTSNEFNCKLCNKSDDMFMVQCDDCDAWFHYTCVGVTSDVENQVWKCTKCTEKSRKSPQNCHICSHPFNATGICIQCEKFSSSQKKEKHDKKSVTSRNSQDKRIKIELQRLEEEQRLQEKYLAKKYELLMKLSENRSETRTIDNDRYSEITKVEIDRQENVAEWVTRARAFMKPESAIIKTYPKSANSIPMCNTKEKLCEQSFPLSTFIENRTLNNQQIVARQAVSKELPIFNGNPETWPLFISNYERTTATCGFSNDENLIRLQKCLRGKALEAVRWQLLMPQNVPKIIFTLKTLFGRPEFIIENLIRKIRSEPSVKSEKLESLVTFALSVQNLCATIEASDMQQHLNNPSLLQELINRLPTQWKLNWAIYKQNLQQSGPITIKIFSIWLFDLAQAANEVSGTYAAESYEIKNQKRGFRERDVLNTHSFDNKYSTHRQCQQTQENNKRVCWICKNTCPSLKDCEKFVRLNRNEKWNAVKQYNLCRTCLRYHGTQRCRYIIECGIDGCTAKHHPLLHKQKREPTKSEETCEVENERNCNVHRNITQSILFRILPVTINAGNKKLKTFAFFDEGSSLTLIENSLAEQLNLKGEVEPLCLKWTANTHRVENNSRRVSFTISGFENPNKHYTISNARTVKSLDLPTQTLAAQELQKRYTHLRGIPFCSYKHAKPGILIGLDNFKLSLPLKCHEGAQNEPVAAKTRLGWTICGKNKFNEFSSLSPQYHNFHTCEYFQPAKYNKKLESENEGRSRLLMENTLRKLDKRHEIELLWKHDSFDAPDLQYKKWLKWITQLHHIESIRIPRCYLKNIKISECETQLHIFVDASEEAYAAAAYLRCRKRDDIQCALLGSKTRVAPLKYLSISRLELQAAIKWPNNIHEDITIYEEMRPHIGHQVVKLPQILDSTRFSKWERILHAQIYVQRFCYNLISLKERKPKRVGPIQSDEYQKAESFLYRQAQWTSFPDEITVLQKNRTSPRNVENNVEKTSSIFKLSPCLDGNGVLRMKGRIDATEGICNDMKRPIILPKENRITKLVVDFYHRKYHHQNSETIVNELRQKFHIPKLRVMVKQVAKECQQCKINKAVPKIPEMAPLPPARLATFTRPFSYVGIDYFGPITVVVGRRQEKRWGVLFTCLTIRAVHIEIAHSLTTDSCIMCLKNFIARRGNPKEIYTDNGTNFHGAEQELRNLVRNLDQTKIMEIFVNSECKWSFIPPSAPHMGGSWERLIRSIKSILYAINPRKTPSDELLRNMMAEVEKTINSRPLTYVPLEEESDEALTPNHFLLGTSSGEKSTGEIPIEENGSYLRRNWMISQQFANLFWKRWIREYLPTITRRTKWYKNTESLAKGDIVIVVDETSRRNLWLKGKIIEIKKSKDQQVRRVVVQTKNGILERPTAKIAKLDIQTGCANLTEEVKLPGGSVNSGDS